MVETTTAIRTLTRDQWDTLVQTFRDLSYQQCRSYCEEAARDTGATCELIGIYRDTELVGLANVRIRISPLLSFGIAYLSCGPLTARDDLFSGGVFGFCIEALKREYVEKRNLLLRLVPPLRGGQWFDAEIGLLENYGFRRSKRYEPYKTFILDLSPPLAEIRKNLDGKWRGHLSKAQRSDIEVTHSVALSDFDHLEPIFQTLIEHKRFTTRRDVKFFRRVQASEQSALQFVVHLAWHNDELIAGHIGSFVGDTAVYLVGAQTSKGRDLRASYLLLWKAIEHAKSKGNLFYDLGGINERENPSVYSFKKGVCGRHVVEPGAYEYAPSSFASAALGLMQAGYGWLQHLRK